MARTWTLVIVCALARGAAAQPAPPPDEPDAGSDAAALFAAGLDAQDHGDPDRACELFARALKQDPRAIGALINLGQCNENRGKIATAYGMYQRALEFATAAGYAKQREAMQAKLTALAAQVPIVELVIETPTPNAKLLVDDAVVQPGDLPIDPGDHVVVYTAPGRLPFQDQLRIGLGEHVRVTLGELAVPQPEVVIERVGNRRRSIGIAATITGAGLLVVAGGLVFYANRLYDRQFDDPDGAGPMLAPCGGRPIIDGHDGCSPDGESAVSRARTLGTTSTVLTAIGLAAATTGVILWLTSPSGEAHRSATVAPVIGPDGFGLALTAGF